MPFAMNIRRVSLKAASHASIDPPPGDSASDTNAISKIATTESTLRPTISAGNMIEPSLIASGLLTFCPLRCTLRLRLRLRLRLLLLGIQ